MGKHITAMVNGSGLWQMFALAGLALVLVEPAFANKFETIGGGVSGSTRIKTEHVRLILYIVSGLFLFGAILTVVMPHKNPLYLNFSQWKQSAIMMLIISVIALVTAILL